MDIVLRDPFVLRGCPPAPSSSPSWSPPSFEGERLKYSAKGTANARLGDDQPDGTAVIDAKILLESDDGALIFCSYTGRSRHRHPDRLCRSTFQTGDEHTAWLEQPRGCRQGQDRPEDPHLRARRS